MPVCWIAQQVGDEFRAVAGVHARQIAVDLVEGDHERVHVLVTALDCGKAFMVQRHMIDLPADLHGQHVFGRHDARVIGIADESGVCP